MNGHARHDVTSAIAPFLASQEAVQRQLLESEDFKDFLVLATKSSGDLPRSFELEVVRFRVMDARQGSLGDQGIDHTIQAWGQPVSIRSLVTTACMVERTRLVHSLWQLETFDEVKLWLKAMGAIPRFAVDDENRWRGQLLLPENIIPMVETIERKEYVLPNGDMASDAITRCLGIRAKVFALDRLRRTPNNTHSIMDRLSRTLSKIKP